MNTRIIFRLAALLSLLALASPAVAQTSTPLGINCPPNRTNWLCGVASTAIVTYPAPATTSACPTNAIVTCAPPSGAVFILGTTTVTCRATNSCRQSAVCSFTVTVARDATPPAIQCPTNRIVWLCGSTATTTTVSWPPPTATDNADTRVAVTCSPPSGSTFPLGTTTVTCTATDNCTNRSTCTFTVSVARDTTPPVIQCPPSISVTACSASGAMATYPTPTATDNADFDVAVTCSPASGRVFPLGTTTVTCTATDDCTNRTTCTFLVRVTHDTTPPVITCPSNRVVWTCSPTGTVVNFNTPTATDNLDATPTVACSPPSGSVFPLGTNIVTCTATDDCTNRSICSFTVTVRPPLLYDGLCHSPLGLAVLNVNTNDELAVSGLGASGQDGVRIDLGDSKGLHWRMKHPPGQPTGDMEVRVLGRTTTGTEVPLSRLFYEFRGPRLFVRPGGASYGFKLLRQGAVVFEQSGRTGAFEIPPCHHVEQEHCVEWPDLNPAVSHCISFLAIECDWDTDIGPVRADALVVTPEDPLPPFTAITSIEILGRNLPVLTLHTERLLMFGSPEQPSIPHRALGQARLVAEDGTLTLADLGPSGMDGARIELGERQGLRWRMENPPGLPEGDMEIEVLGRTAAGAEVPIRRISHHYRSGRTSVTPGTGPYEFKLLLRGQVVFQQAGRTGDVDIPECHHVENENCVGDPFAAWHPGLLPYCHTFLTVECDWETPAGPVRADTLVLTPADPTPAVVALSAVQILGRNVRDLPVLKLNAERLLTFGGSELRLARPSNITLRTCSTNPVPVSFPPQVVSGGTCTLPASVVCVPSSGSLFPPGVTTVQCTATNVCGERAVCHFTVTVLADTTPPVIQCTSNMVFNCLCPGTIINLDFFQATATDDRDPNPTIVCNPPSLVSSPGVHVVTCTATDNCGNSNRCSFTVTFNYDTTPPVITCPTNMNIWTCSNFAVVNYSARAADTCTANVNLVCTPPSGSTMPIGITTVNCVATDDCGNTARCTFLVAVRAPRIDVVAVAGGLLLSWPDGGALEEADTLSGPWRLDPDARSPHRVAATRAQRFFRLTILGDGNGTGIFCPSGEETNPRLTDVPSRMHYASTHVREEFEEYEDVSETPPTNSHPPRVPAYDPRPGEGYAWNSAVGRRFLLDIGDVGEDREGAASHSHGSVEQQIAEGVASPFCVNPSFYVSAGDRVFSGWSEMTFQAPRNAFATKVEAEAFLLKVHAEQPFFLPFTDPDVKLGHGWHYNSGKLHRACDYSRSGVEENEDPTFLVTSAGNGVVVATDWDGNGGNYVAVESTAPGGQKVMFIYLHLRDGRTHDIAKAKTSTSMDEKYVKYRAFAYGYPDHLSWGSEDHKIKVQVGDTVSVGTPLAWAGNTGAGGAGSGLNDDGSPKNWTGNLHLHVYVAVPHPTVLNTWVWVDPYGVYQEVDTGCYDLLKDTKFSRLYAPFYPTFHGVPYEVFKHYWGYYPDMGMKLRTLSIHRDGDSLLASGSFQSGIPGGWFLHTYRTIDEFQDLADEHYAQGYIMRETTVEKTMGGQPRFSAIWRPLEPGESIEHRAQLTDAQWADLWQDRVVEDEWRLEDYFGYSVGGVNFHSAFVTSHEGRPFLYSGLLTSGVFDQTIDDYKADGYLPVSFNAASRTGGLRFSGIFRDLPGCWKVAWGLTPSGYQSYVSQQIQLGYRVWKVQGYGNSGRYGVILHDPTGPCQ